MTAPFVYLDEPAYRDLPLLPALPTFVDGSLVHQSDLNSLGTHLRYLNRYALGDKPDGKPLTILRQTTGQAFTTGVPALLRWDAASKNTDSAWSLADPYTIVVRTPGLYRVYCGAGTTATTAANCALYLLVNGSDFISNLAGTTTYYGNFNNVETTVQLSSTATLQAAWMQSSGSTINTSTSYGGSRLEVEFLTP